jgi:hypothetical protein
LALGCVTIGVEGYAPLGRQKGSDLLSSGVPDAKSISSTGTPRRCASGLSVVYQCPHHQGKELLGIYIPQIELLESLESVGKFTPIHEEFMGAFQPTKRLTALKARQASGKTKVSLEAIRAFEKKIIISHRTLLVRDQRYRYMNLDGDPPIGHYEEIKDSGGLEKYTESLVICINSIGQLDPENYRGAVIFIDEVSQLLAAINSDLFNPIRRKVIANFREILKNALHVIVSDADLEKRHLELLMQWMEIASQDIELIWNTYVDENAGIVNRHGSFASAVTKLLQHAKLGLKAWVNYDNLGGAEALQRRLEAKGYSVFLLSSETEKSEKIEFMDNINRAVRDYQIVITTSAGFTGINLDEDYFDDVFVLAEGVTNSLLPSDFVQAMRRVRNPLGEIHTWVMEKNLSLTTDVGEIENRYLTNGISQKDLRQKNWWEWVNVVKNYTDFFVESTAHKHESINTLGGCVVTSLHDA